MNPKPKIFISTVSREFRSARAQVGHVLQFLGYEPEQQEIFGTEQGDLRQNLRDKIDACDGLVQIVGRGYGAEPPTEDADYGRVSYTQFEFLYARLRGKKTWLIFAGDDARRDTAVELLDRPDDPDHADPDGHQAERRALQEAYRQALEADGHFRWSYSNDTELENLVLKLRNDSVELRQEFRSWQEEMRRSQEALVEGQRSSRSFILAVLAALALLVVAGFAWVQRSGEKNAAAIKAGQQTNDVAKLRAQLFISVTATRAKDVAAAEAVTGDWERRQRLVQAAEATYQRNLSDIDALALEFIRLAGGPEATVIFQDLTRIAKDQGVAEALRYLQSQRDTVFSSVQADRTRIREKLQPWLSGARLAVSIGDFATAESHFRDVVQGDPGWPEARHELFEFLIWSKGARAESRGTTAEAAAIYQDAERIARRLFDDQPKSSAWQRDLSVSLDRLGDLAVAQGDLAVALRSFTECHAILEHLAQSDPANAAWQRDLAQSHCWVGMMQQQNGDAEKAKVSFTAYKDTMERLAASDPANAVWQFDLGISNERLGELAVAQGKLDDALVFHTARKDIIERLAQSDPANAEWQRDLMVSCWKLADLGERSGKVEEAKTLWRKAHDTLSGMEQRGIMRPTDAPYLRTLRAKVAGD